MSYDIHVYHSSVKEKTSQGLEFDEFEHPAFLETEVKEFIDRLEKYGYQLDFENASVKEFIKTAAGCPIQVSVFPNEIGFSIPYWENSDQAIVEALQDATELSDTDGMSVYDPQTGEWVT